jgi:GNAT superfamily N-acetyltransferase
MLDALLQSQLIQLSLTGADCWTIDCAFVTATGEQFRIRNVADGDVALLHEFGDTLGPQSKDFFCPYPWADSAQLTKAFADAIQQALRRIDLSFLMLRDGRPIGHFFLWKAGGNPHSAAYTLQVPELGVAVSDLCQRRGLGELSVRLLLAMARSLGADAVELTTALTNAGGWNTYLKTGFEHVGNMRVPLDVDVTSVALGLVQATRYREERQMVYIINEEHRQQVLEYLAIKRGLAV